MHIQNMSSLLKKYCNAVQEPIALICKLIIYTDFVN